ncbi:MAG: hypothetical protein MRJ68_14790 [Nitrospira sp.]|nr:hypothetical protein [Nitrospira sp.]
MIRNTTLPGTHRGALSLVEYLPAHIPLKLRKALSGRRLFIEAAASVRERFLEQDSSAYEDLQRDILSRAYKDAELSPNHIPLDIFLDNFCCELEYRAEPDLRKPYGSLIEAIVQGMKRRAGEICCNTCSPFRPKICNGGDEDQHIVDSGGLCIESFRKMFKLSLDVTAKYYNDLGHVPNTCHPEVVLHTRFTERIPNDIPGGFFVNGITSFGITNTGRLRSEICLELCVRRFDWNTYLVLPYVMFHECISHAFYGISFGRRREITKPDDVFAEGWMDFVACEIMTEVLKGVSTLGIQQTLVFPSDHLLTGVRYHSNRSNINNALDINESQYAIHRAIGKDAADKVCYLIERLSESPQQAWRKFLNLSFNLNVGRFEIQELEVFVRNIRP